MALSPVIEMYPALQAYVLQWRSGGAAKLPHYFARILVVSITDEQSMHLKAENPALTQA